MTPRRAFRAPGACASFLVLGSLLCGGCRRAPTLHAKDEAPAEAKTPPAAPAPPLPAPSSASPAAPETAVASVSDEELVAEERERDPRSETVTIKVIVDSRRKAHVFWGRKDLGEAPLEVQRPRNSGPLDLTVVAAGFLPLHTRAFTDRDDKLILRLFSAEEAPQMLGYTPPSSVPPPHRSR
jgi:hypothetical protein